MSLRTIKRILKPELNYVGNLVAYHFNDLPFEEFDPFLMLATMAARNLNLLTGDCLLHHTHIADLRQ